MLCMPLWCSQNSRGFDMCFRQAFYASGITDWNKIWIENRRLLDPVVKYLGILVLVVMVAIGKTKNITWCAKLNTFQNRTYLGCLHKNKLQSWLEGCFVYYIYVVFLPWNDRIKIFLDESEGTENDGTPWMALTQFFQLSWYKTV